MPSSAALRRTCSSPASCTAASPGSGARERPAAGPCAARSACRPAGSGAATAATVGGAVVAGGGLVSAGVEVAAVLAGAVLERFSVSCKRAVGTSMAGGSEGVGAGDDINFAAAADSSSFVRSVAGSLSASCLVRSVSSETLAAPTERFSAFRRSFSAALPCPSYEAHVSASTPSLSFFKACRFEEAEHNSAQSNSKPHKSDPSHRNIFFRELVLRALRKVLAQELEERSVERCGSRHSLRRWSGARDCVKLGRTAGAAAPLGSAGRWSLSR